METHNQNITSSQMIPNVTVHAKMSEKLDLAIMKALLKELKPLLIFKPKNHIDTKIVLTSLMHLQCDSLLIFRENQHMYMCIYLLGIG